MESSLHCPSSHQTLALVQMAAPLVRLGRTHNMIESMGLLGSEIFDIQETWMGWCGLEYANYALKTLSKGLTIFCPVSPSESLKVMGLTNIHQPDTLCHFSRTTHCLWCGKEGQNKGTIINHLQTMHYKLGLVCKKCFFCPSVTSEAI